MNQGREFLYCSISGTVPFWHWQENSRVPCAFRQQLACNLGAETKKQQRAELYRVASVDQVGAADVTTSVGFGLAPVGYRQYQYTGQLSSSSAGMSGLSNAPFSSGETAPALKSGGTV